MNTNLLLTLLVGAMVLVSVLQTFQLVGLSSALQSGGVALRTGASAVGAAVAGAAASSGTAASSLPAGGSDLPEMVGGCQIIYEENLLNARVQSKLMRANENPYGFSLRENNFFHIRCERVRFAKTSERIQK